MKTLYRKIKTVLLVMIITPIINAQTTENDNVFWVMEKNTPTENTEKSAEETPSLDDLFEEYNVTKYEQALPFAKTPALQNVYEVACDCNAENLIEEIEANYSDIFSGVKRLDYDNIVLYDPVDYMWAAHANDWLWYLKKIEADLAWDITKGDSNVVTAVLDTDFDITHPDLAGEFAVNYDPYDSIAFDCNLIHGHGTAVASYVSGETTEIGGTPNGQLASVGFNTKMIGYKAWSGSYLARALHASSVMDANILTSSAGGWSSCPDQSGIDELIVKEILDNGTTIVMPAGNGDGGTHNVCNSIDSIYHSAFFPLSPYYDERIILVSSTGKQDQHSNGSGTHSHYPDVDLCSPGYNTMSAQPTNCGSSQWPYYGFSSGTSFATPIVAGVASLMYSVNPCMTPSWCQDILKNTTDPITDAASFPGGLGTGRVNAYEAVKAAQSAYSSTLDLYIKDRPEDFGNEQYPYHWQADRDKSPDIWVRNQQDGFSNQIHEQPEYQSSSPVYVYVRVRNKSCDSTNGDEDLSLYWSKASSWSSWPQNWDGSQPSIGDNIGTINIGNLAPGRDTILEFTWNILDPYIHQNWSSCLLARIENSSVDGITIHPGRLDDDVFFNNNIAMRNVTITNIIGGIVAPPGEIDETYYPHGSFMYIGNPNEEMEILDFRFSVSEDSLKESILEEAEVKLIFDDVGWELLEQRLKDNPSIEVIGEREVLLKEDAVEISNISMPSNTRIPIYVGFSFLIGELSADQQQFSYHVRQYLSEDLSLLGGVHYEINRDEDRDFFEANAGNDKVINKGESVNIEANPIGEPAIYNWYNEQGDLIHNGTDYSVSPETTQNYKLEVIAEADGYKDYDEIEVNVNTSWIQNLSPNPALDYVIVEYVAHEAEEAYLSVVNQSSTVVNEYALDVMQPQIEISLSDYQTGVYTVVLICDGEIVDSRNLVVE